MLGSGVVTQTGRYLAMQVAILEVPTGRLGSVRFNGRLNILLLQISEVVVLIFHISAI